MSPNDPCVVCPHVRREHVMAENIKDWRGDYCIVCQAWCKEG